MQIAVYGKGGIGKSTVSANLSAALASRMQHVLQIGCDPKHDSTRLLHHGQDVKTILDYLLDTAEDDQRLEDVLMKGYLGVGCAEAGGPRPGMGCAGRGILTAFEFLKRFHAFAGYDQIVYDVLGDVVCGGFAVPVRKQYADAVFLVTSGEAMSIYAANNILHGIRNLSPDERRVAGIIYNSRGEGDEYGKVETFARAVGLPILTKIPRSSAFMRAEMQAMTVVELDSGSAEAAAFMKLADSIIAGLTLYMASPLDEAQMEGFIRGGDLAVVTREVDVLGRHADRDRDRENISGNVACENVMSSECSVMDAALTESAASGIPLSGHASSGCAAVENEKKTIRVPAEPAPSSAPKKRALSDPYSRVPLFGCAYRGAIDLAVHIKDAAVLGHAPKSCTWYAMNGVSSYARRGLYERGMLYPAFIPRQFDNTDITLEDAVFGGVEHARKTALAMVERGVRTIIAVTACIPGLSGDDLEPVKKEVEALGREMYIIHTDGIEAGDYNEGMALCYLTLADEAVRRDVAVEPDCINLVYEHTISSQADQSYELLADLLGQMGIRINCRFLCATTMEDIHGFLRAPYSVMARTDALGQRLKALFEEKYGCRFVDGVLPRGFRETAAWIREIGRLYGKAQEAERIISDARGQYEEKITTLMPAFAGKRILIFLKDEHARWVQELAEDLKWDVAEALIYGDVSDGVRNWNRRYSGKWEDDRHALAEAVKRSRPDLVITDDDSSSGALPEGVTVIDIRQEVRREIGIGFFAAVGLAGRWSAQLDNTLKGGWMHDRAVFERCFS